MDHDRTTPLHWKLTQMTASLIHEQSRDILPSSIVQRKTFPSSPTKQGEAHQQFQCAEALTHLPSSVITNINVSLHPSNQSLLPLTPDTDETYPTSPRLVETHLATSHLKMDITHPSITPTQHNISSLPLRCSSPLSKAHVTLSPFQKRQIHRMVHIMHASTKEDSLDDTPDSKLDSTRHQSRLRHRFVFSRVRTRQLVSSKNYRIRTHIHTNTHTHTHTHTQPD